MTSLCKPSGFTHNELIDFGVIGKDRSSAAQCGAYKMHVTRAWEDRKVFHFGKGILRFVDLLDE